MLVVAVMALLGLASVGPTASPAAALGRREIAALAGEIVGFSSSSAQSSSLQVSADPTGGTSLLALGAAPAGLAAADVVLNPADVGPDFILASGGDRIQFGASWRAQNLVRGGKLISYVEPDGVLGVRSFALVTPDPLSAEEIFLQAGQSLFDGTQELPIPRIGEHSRGAIQWGDGPFSTAAKIVLFRVRAVVGGVIVGTFEAPVGMDDVVALARTMAARAGR